jgi:hypothetical protein
MGMLTALLVVTLLAGRAVPAADGRAREATEPEWAACIEQVQAELAPQGLCGASNCYDAAGRDLIDICVARVGYPRHTAMETAGLLRDISAGDISNVTRARVRTYPPGHAVRQAYEKARSTRRPRAD